MAIETQGFGVPNATGPHHFIVSIPAGRNDPVLVLENYGLNGESITARPVVRVIISRDAWRVVADPLKAYLNRRLKEKGFKVSRFATGVNMVERLLGHEIAVLAWAIEQANEENARIAFTRWASHRPEELHWLYQRIVADAGKPEEQAIGWRLAIKQAMIVNDERPSPRRDINMTKKTKKESQGEQPSLFVS